MTFSQVLFTRLLLASMMALLGCALCNAQDEKSKTFKKNGVELSVKAPKSATSGSTFEFAIKVRIPDGYHIYGSKDKSMPSKIAFDKTDGVIVSEAEVPAGIFHAKPRGGVNFWLEGLQTINGAVELSDDVVGDVKLSGKLSFMICDEKTCRPPADIPFEFSVAIDSTGNQKLPSLFSDPVRIKAAGEIVSVEAPGYAFPCLADIDGDGEKDLLVGQFNGGKIKVYPGKGDGKFGVGDWLKADGKVAEVPGVW